MSVPSVTATPLTGLEERRASDAAPSPLLAISNQTVQLYKQAFGRGPTKARTLFADANTILILLEDALTAGEQTLLDAGADDLLREFRRAIQGVLEPALRSLVERTLGRRTRALIAGIDASRATSAYVITLEPAAPAGGSTVSAAAESAPR
ncbi:MAG TPA: Na-translocating system protein MpsC family protein [Solirubrobacteraceae bacterium]|nr:Na-translocating system protein MpsC family protein [Solirubrobacteraceae bacterium]